MTRFRGTPNTIPGLMILVALSAPMAAYAQSATGGDGNRRCLFCHEKEEFREKVRQDGRQGLFVDGAEFAASVHGKRLCRECHADAVEIPHPVGLERVTCSRCHYVGNVVGAPESRRYKQYRESIHGQLAASGDSRAPLCQDCHGTHRIQPADDPTSRVHRRNIADDCGRCHEAAKNDYLESDHGALASRGDLDAPVCTDCHSEHNIRRHEDPESQVYSSHVPDNCARCHEDGQVMNRHGFDAAPVATYKGSFHGVALKFGVTKVANCISCHSYHKVLPKEDPRSTVHPSNLAKTCGKAACHPGATDNFARGRIHISAHEESAGNVYLVATAFKWLTIVVMSGLVLHILLDLAGHLFRRRRKGADRKDHVAAPNVASILETPLRRLDLFVRVQHGSMAVSVVLLVITGIPVKFHEAAWAASMMDAMGGVPVTAFVHRLAAAILMAVSLAHVIYITITPKGRKNFYSMIPRPVDVKQIIQNLGFFLGIREERPLFDRFSYLEKFDYWAVYWGIVIMVGTGLVLWFETGFMQFFPKEWVDIAKEMHSDEAMLATLAIVVWHFFNAHFNPDKFPMNPVFWHGKTTLGDMLDEHPAELARRVRKGRVDKNLLLDIAPDVPRALDVLDMAFPVDQETGDIEEDKL